MALCSLFSFVHELGPNARTARDLAIRLRRLSSNGNRAYGLLPLNLGQPIKNIVESADLLANPERPFGVALRSWVNKDPGTRDGDGLNAPLMRIHPVSASKQPFPSQPTHRIIVLCLDEIKGLCSEQIRGLTQKLNQSPLRKTCIGIL